jgi:hypothetical protein
VSADVPILIFDLPGHAPSWVHHSCIFVVDEILLLEGRSHLGIKSEVPYFDFDRDCLMRDASV